VGGLGLDGAELICENRDTQIYINRLVSRPVNLINRDWHNQYARTVHNLNINWIKVYKQLNIHCISNSVL